jgi:hypothetical protein
MLTIGRIQVEGPEDGERLHRSNRIACKQDAALGEQHGDTAAGLGV